MYISSSSYLVCVRLVSVLLFTWVVLDWCVHTSSLYLGCVRLVCAHFVSFFGKFYYGFLARVNAEETNEGVTQRGERRG